MVSNQKTIFFSRKPKNQKKKKKKTSFPKLWGWGLQKMVFLVFSRKRWFFGSKPSFSREKDGFWRSSPGKTIFFSRKRWFSEGCFLKTIFFSRKRWFRTKRPSFSRENQKNQKKTKKKKKKKHLFQNYGAGASKRWFLLVFVGFFCFLEKKMVFWFETIFFSRKRWFYQERRPPKTISFSRKRWFRTKKPSFSRENQKNQKKHLFQNYGAGASNRCFFWFFWFSREKDGFLVRNHLFLEKKMVLPGEDLQKPSFSREKDGFTEPKKPSFLEKTKKTIFWRPQPHSFGKDGFFGFFGFFGFLVFC